MKCEFCGKDDYILVNQYESPAVCKIIACIDCIRRLDELIEIKSRAFIDDINNMIKSMIKKNEGENK